MGQCGGRRHERKTWSVPDFYFAQTINRLKGKVTMIFITHQVPKGLQVDEVWTWGGMPCT